MTLLSFDQTSPLLQNLFGKTRLSGFLTWKESAKHCLRFLELMGSCNILRLLVKPHTEETQTLWISV